MKKYIYIAIALVIAGLAASTFFYQQKAVLVQNQNELLNKNLKTMQLNYNTLAFVYGKLLKQKNYSISLSPNINNKVNSTFGSAKNLTFQYYFTMNGNKIELQPDSTITLTEK